MDRVVVTQSNRYRGYFKYDYKSKQCGDICCDIVGKILESGTYLCLMGIDEDLDRCISTTIKKGPPPRIGAKR